MGIDEIGIKEVYITQTPVTEDGPLLYIIGDNFTEWSCITVNEEKLDTIYLNRRLLAATKLPESEEGVYYISVQQQGNDEIVLSETEVIEYNMEN